MANRQILVLGCGSIGRRHIGNLQKLGCVVTAFDSDSARLDWAVRNLGCRSVYDPEAGFKLKPNATWICTPPHMHGAPARQSLSLGIPCFLEKPLAHSLADARSIVRLSRRQGVPAAVGYQWRGHPALRWIKAQMEEGRWGRLLFLRAEQGQYLPDWRPWQDYRKSYTARRRMGGGILLDASHEIDLALWLGGEVESVYCAAGRLSDLEIDVEDTVSMVLNFQGRARGEVHLDMVQRAYRRNIELAFSEGSVFWDFPTSEVKAYSARTGRWTRRRFPVEINSLYMNEARDFLAHLENPSRNAFLTADEGARTLQVVAAAERSARSRRLERISA